MYMNITYTNSDIIHAGILKCTRNHKRIHTYQLMHKNAYKCTLTSIYTTSTQTYIHIYTYKLI